MLTIKNLHMKLEARAKPILKGLSLEVVDGEVDAIMAPNGADGSTLADALAGRQGYDPFIGAAA